MRGRGLGQQAQGVGQDVEDGLQLFNAALGRTGCVAHDRLPAYAHDASREPPQRVDQPHRLGETGRLTFDYCTGSFGGLVARCETGAPGADHQSGKPTGEPVQGRGDAVGTVGDDLVFDDIETAVLQKFDQGGPAGIDTGAGDDPVADLRAGLGRLRCRVHPRRPR